MMRHLSSERVGDFAAIYDEDVELISVDRSRSDALEDLKAQVFSLPYLVQARWEQGPGGADSTAAATPVDESLPPSLDAAGLATLQAEITAAGDMLCELLGCSHVGVRVTALRGPMCPRFHVDRVPCRLLITLGGGGTEWIPNPAVDRELFADRDNQAPPLRTDGAIEQLAATNWSLLKGGAWDGSFTGVVHRSPHQPGERLLLSLDPIFRGPRRYN